MTMEFTVRLIFCLLLGGLVFWQTHSRLQDEQDENRIGQRYKPYMATAMLPCILLALLLIYPFLYGMKSTVQMALSVAFGMFVHISVYYLILAALMPLLRRRISSRACAMLWVIPNFLYITQYSAMEISAPKLVIRMSYTALWIISALWLAGFLAVIVWKITEHLVFRSNVLKNACEVTDERVLEVWERELDDAYEKKPKYKVVISPSISTPLSVGFFKRFTKVVLPQREYNDEELAMIFRHEIVHLSRADSLNKFFLVFCTALCWFNPLMWMAMKKSAEDIELSCDETVLLKADEEARYKYAELLLKNAGSTKGFTTCLSASASSLLYRLKSVTGAKKTRTGALLAGLACFVLVISYGNIALAYGGTTGADVLYESGNISDYQLKSVRPVGEDFGSSFYCTDEPAFHELLANTEMITVSGNYSFTEDGKGYYMVLGTPKGMLGVIISDNYITFDPFYNLTGEKNDKAYYLPQGMDWECFEKLIIENPDLG